MVKKGSFDDLIKAAGKKKVKKAKVEVIKLNKRVDEKIKKLESKRRKLKTKVDEATTLKDQRQRIKELKETLAELNGINAAKKKVRQVVSQTAKAIKISGRGTVKTARIAGKLAGESLLFMNKLANRLDPPRRRRRSSSKRKR